MSPWRSRLAIAAVLLSFVVPLTTAARAENRVARLGLLGIFSRDGSLENLAALREGPRERGWVEGKNIVIEERWAEGKIEQLPALAADLVHLKVDVIFAGNQPLVLAAKNATVTIPIMMITRDDPVRVGLVTSLAWPGRNITGLSMTADAGLVGKQLQLLTQLVPAPSRVAVLMDPVDLLAAHIMDEAERAARSLKIRVQAFEVSNPDDLDSVFLR
jgi:ABC-type uncharacterized transport system substrate-binding protein